MRKIKLAVTLATLLLVIAHAQIANVTVANFTPYDVLLPEIAIKSDGSVTPETEFINHTGNTYTLTNDIANYSLLIQCSNITLVGKGHRINGSQPSPYETNNYGLFLDHVANVTVSDLDVAGFNEYEAIRMTNCSECNIVRVKAPTIKMLNGNFNTIAWSSINRSLDMQNSHNNIVSKNVIGGLTLGVSHQTLVTENTITSLIVQFCDSNRYYRNNFLCSYYSFQYYFSNKESFWDNGTVGNYWSDYLDRFPNASEIDNSGIGDTPYVINQVHQAWKYGELVDVTWILGKVIDHCPLMAPVDFLPPAIKVLSIASKPYDSDTIPLDFSVNEVASQIAYSLDGEENVTITGNITLTGLVNGRHDLTIFAKDEAGNVGASETIVFSVDVPFPTALAVAAGLAAVVALAALVHRKKQRRKIL